MPAPEPSLTAADELPLYIDRRTAAQLVTKRFFPMKPYAIALWPLPVRFIGRTTMVATEDVLAYAQRIIDEAPRTALSVKQKTANKRQREAAMQAA